MTLEQLKKLRKMILEIHPSAPAEIYQNAIELLDMAEIGIIVTRREDYKMFEQLKHNTLSNKK